MKAIYHQCLFSSGYRSLDWVDQELLLFKDIDLEKNDEEKEERIKLYVKVLNH